MKKENLVIALIAICVFLISCRKNTETVPTRDLRDGINHTVSQLKSIANCTANGCQGRRIKYEAYVKGVVIADEVCGNFYKEIYLRDAKSTGAIHFSFLKSSSNLFIGDSLRLNLKGYDVNINPDTQLLEIDTVDFEKSIVKFGSGAIPQPISVSLSQSAYSDYYGELINLSNVGFLPGDTNKPYADPIKQLSYNHTLQDCGLHQVIVRTSNNASFAQQKTPKGNGNVVGIATSYAGTDQLLLRSAGDAHMTGSGCITYHKKDFNDYVLTSGNWSQYSVLNGSVLWTASSYNTLKYAKISGYVSGNQKSENWLISPAINLSNSFNPVITFATAAKYAGNELELWISKDYVSGAPSSASWIQLNSFELSPNNPGAYSWTPSGAVSLSNFKCSNIRIAFKYTSESSGATTYELDDIIIREN